MVVSLSIHHECFNNVTVGIKFSPYTDTLEGISKIIRRKSHYNKDAMDFVTIFMYPPPRLAVGFLVGWRSVSVNLIISHGIVGLPALIAGVALHGVDHTVLHLLHDAHMVA